MATRSTISKKNPDGTYSTIYCHWDGYPSNNGKLLLKYYNTDEKVNELISLGDLSYLESQLSPPNGIKHSFDEPCEGVVVAYHRDRGEDLVIRKTNNIKSIFGKYSQEWNYLWKNGKWYVAKDDKNTTFVELTQEICDNEY